MTVAIIRSPFFLRKDYQWPVIVSCIVLAGCIAAFPFTWISKTNSLIGVCMLPFAVFIDGSRKFNIYYFSVFFFFSVTAYIWNVRTFYFFGVSFYVLFMIEWTCGKLNPIVLFLTLFMSPFFDQISIILGFPLRLELSRLAGIILSCAGSDIRVEGNEMVTSGASFAVEDVCLGLNMLAVSFLAGVFTLIRFYRNVYLRLSGFFIGIFFAIVIALNLISNILRILLLVVFKVMPENPLHEGIGLLCFLLYVLTPLQIIARLLINRFGKFQGTSNFSFRFSAAKKWILTSLAVVVLVSGIHLHDERQSSGELFLNASMPGFTLSKPEANVIKMVNDDLLVYVKPIPEFFTGEHSPLMCWKGSGYKFSKIGKITVGALEVYTGTLEKKDQKLFTSWWYSNGKAESIDQAFWRTAMLKGEDRFCLVNITSYSEEKLMLGLNKIIDGHLLTIDTNERKQQLSTHSSR